MIRRGFSCVALLLVSVAGYCETNDALQWLQRVAGSAQKLNYAGVFVYQSGNQTETSRIAHSFEGGKELEHLETLDGSPREIIRENGDIRCVLPESRLVVIEHRSPGRSFPGLLPEGLGGLTDYYAIRKGMASRMAGFEAQMILLEPKDEFRYGRQFWAESGSGLLLKAALMGEKGEVKESFSFSELKIGGSIDKESLRGHIKTTSPDWRVHDIRAKETSPEDFPWVFRGVLPGFRLVSGMKRQSRGDGPEVTHMIYSDGIATISVFMEPVATAKAKGDPGLFVVGPMNGYRRILGDIQIVLVGDVPPAALKRLGDGVEARAVDARVSESKRK